MKEEADKGKRRYDRGAKSAARLKKNEKKRTPQEKRVTQRKEDEKETEMGVYLESDLSLVIIYSSAP